ncbi:hypothetical protein [Streptomyces sp. KL118A]|nr:hypothetical protein [Streptomyces sp. KL118A]
MVQKAVRRTGVGAWHTGTGTPILTGVLVPLAAAAALHARRG